MIALLWILHTPDWSGARTWLEISLVFWRSLYGASYLRRTPSSSPSSPSSSSSHEAASRLRSLVGIQGRGRWQSLKSVRNYEKGSRLAQLFGSLDVQTQKQCIQAKKRRSKALVKKALSPQRCMVFPFFLEIISGSGRLGKQLPNTSIGLFYSRILNSERIMICSHDPTNCSLSTGFFPSKGSAGWATSHSQRQRATWTGQPSACRYERKVRQGNCLMRFSCAVLLLALVYHIPWTLENPERSRLWLCPSVQNILRGRAVQLVDVTFCAFGMAWKKPTWIVSVHLGLSILVGFFCKCSKRGICEYSGKWQASHSFVWSPSFRCLVYQDCWTISFQVAQKTGIWFSQTELAAIAEIFLGTCNDPSGKPEGAYVATSGKFGTFWWDGLAEGLAVPWVDGEHLETFV